MPSRLTLGKTDGSSKRSSISAARRVDAVQSASTHSAEVEHCPQESGSDRKAAFHTGGDECHVRTGTVPKKPPKGDADNAGRACVTGASRRPCSSPDYRSSTFCRHAAEGAAITHPIAVLCSGAVRAACRGPQPCIASLALRLIAGSSTQDVHSALNTDRRELSPCLLFQLLTSTLLTTCPLLVTSELQSLVLQLNNLLLTTPPTSTTLHL